MKKWLFVIAIFFVFPMSVMARTATKEDLIETIDSFQNIQVDDNVKILSMEVLKDKIEVTLLENDLPEIRYIPYKLNKNTFTFQGGIVRDGKLENNQYAFYLYSILESKSTAAYDEKNYYNELLILNRSKDLQEGKISFQNWGKTFGLTLEKKDNTIHVLYHYYLDGDDIIMMQEESSNGEFRNPETGNFGTYVTITLMLVIGLAGYTFFKNDKTVKN